MTKEKFEEQVLLLEKNLYSISYSILPNPHDQADAVQECIKKALIKRETLRDERYLKTWLIRILINECHNIVRQRTREEPASEILVVPPAEADNDVFDALNELEEKYRLPIVLHHVSGYTTREVAQIMRIPEGTVKYRLVQGREKLHIILNKKGA